jgi:hypothetical protein
MRNISHLVYCLGGLAMISNESTPLMGAAGGQCRNPDDIFVMYNLSLSNNPIFLFGYLLTDKVFRPAAAAAMASIRHCQIG